MNGQTHFPADLTPVKMNKTVDCGRIGLELLHTWKISFSCSKSKKKKKILRSYGPYPSHLADWVIQNTLWSQYVLSAYKFACYFINPLNAELNPVRHLLVLVGAHHVVHVSKVRLNFSYHASDKGIFFFSTDTILLHLSYLWRYSVEWLAKEEL